jgi:hypothetical protein
MMIDPTPWSARSYTLIVKSFAACTARDGKVIFRQKVCEMI